jgi:3',5'-cyclic AMP phosphodiesterase CpdA
MWHCDKLRLSLIGLAAATLALSSCARKGLLSEEYPASLYRGVERYEVGRHDHDPRFLAYGDTQSGWRLEAKCFRRERWVTKKAFIFPFYYLYNIFHGVVGGFNYLRQVPDYGGVERREVRDALYDEVVRTRPDFLLHLGDMCMNDGRRPGHWATYLGESKVDVPLLSSIPVVPVIGNHEHANDEALGMANYQTVFPGAPRFYVMEFPHLALFVVDSNFILDQYGIIDDEEQDALWREWIVAPPGASHAWLERELARHTQRFKVVAMHHPPVSMGRHFGDWMREDWGRDLRAKRAALIDLLMDNGVHLVLSGHEHVYQHTTVRRVRDGAAGDAVMHVVVTSGGGVPMRPVLGAEEIRECARILREDGLVVDLVRNERINHYSVIDVTADALTVETIGVAGGEGGRPIVECVVITDE